MLGEDLCTVQCVDDAVAGWLLQVAKQVLGEEWAKQAHGQGRSVAEECQRRL